MRSEYLFRKQKINHEDILSQYIAYNKWLNVIWCYLFFDERRFFFFG